MPGDGSVYYVLKPPWIHLDNLQTFYTLHPEERHYTGAVQATLVAEAKARAAEAAAADDEDRRAAHRPAPVLTKRLSWGRNFLTGTAATKLQSKVVQG